MKAFPTLLLLLLAAFGTTGCGGGATPAEAAELPDGQPVKLSFVVMIDGIKLAVPVIGVSGLGTQTTVVERPDGNDQTPDKTAGGTSTSSIVLERGYTATDDLWAWRKEVEAGTVARKSGSIIIFNSSGDEVARYEFFEGWPIKWSVGSLTTSSEQVTETITLVCERIQRVSP